MNTTLRTSDILSNLICGEEVDPFDEHNEIQRSEEGITGCNVMLCILFMAMLDDAWRYATVFYTYAKYGSNSYKIIIDGRSCMKIIFTQALSMIQATLELHPIPYKMAWVN